MQFFSKCPPHCGGRVRPFFRRVPSGMFTGEKPGNIENYFHNYTWTYSFCFCCILIDNPFCKKCKWSETVFPQNFPAVHIRKYSYSNKFEPNSCYPGISVENQKDYTALKSSMNRPFLRAKIEIEIGHKIFCEESSMSHVSAGCRIVLDRLRNFE